MSNAENTKWKYTCFTCNRTMNLSHKNRHNKSTGHFSKVLKKQMAIHGNDPTKWEFLKNLHVSAGISSYNIPYHIANWNKKEADEKKEEEEEVKRGPSYFVNNKPTCVNTTSSGVYFYENNGIKGPEYLYYKQESIGNTVLKNTSKTVISSTINYSDDDDDDIHGDVDGNCNCNKEEGDECNQCIDYEAELKLPQVDGSADFYFPKEKFENLTPELMAEDLWNSDITDEEIVNVVIEYELLQE